MEALSKLPWAAKSPIFKKVPEFRDISALSREECIKYDHFIKVYRDNLCIYESEYEIGFREGYRIAYEEGLRQGLISFVQKAKEIPLDLCIISKK